jgi:hypothetical protein
VWKDSGGTTWVYVTDESGDLDAYKVVTSGGVSSLSQVYSFYSGVSSSPFVANGVLYLDGDTLKAYNAKTGAKLFDSSSLGISLNQHWESPIVVNGMVFTPDGSTGLYGFYIPGVTRLPSTSSSSSSTSSTSSSSSTATKKTTTTSRPKPKTATKTVKKQTTATPAVPTQPKVASTAAAKPTGIAAALDFVRTSFSNHNWPVMALCVVAPLLVLAGLYIAGLWSARCYLPLVRARLHL